MKGSADGKTNDSGQEDNNKREGDSEKAARPTIHPTILSQICRDDSQVLSCRLIGKVPHRTGPTLPQRLARLDSVRLVVFRRSLIEPPRSHSIESAKCAACKEINSHDNS
jgi:hypothetical protein